MLLKNNLPDTAFAAALTALDGIGSRTLHRLREYFDSAHAIWTAPAATLLEVVPQRIVHNITSQRQTIDVKQLWQKIKLHHLNIVTWESNKYPPLLKEISDPPYLLFVRGDTAILHQRCLSVVGTRQATSYGKTVVEALVPPLAAYGYTIVSGLAFGIDSFAHQAALTKGKTIAVLAHGLDRVHPADNRGLAQAIIAGGGALVSEYAPGIEAARGRFPQRNRIIAGLSAQTLVIEAPERSGALITAHLAIDENREVLAVPGSIFSEASQGTNRLIHDGASVIRSAEDITGIARKSHVSVEEVALSELGKKVLDALIDGPLHIDNIVAACNLDPSAVGAELAYLELNGIVTNLGSQRYQRTR